MQEKIFFDFPFKIVGIGGGRGVSNTMAGP